MEISNCLGTEKNLQSPQHTHRHTDREREGEREGGREIHAPYSRPSTPEDPGWGGYGGEEWDAEVSSSHSFQHYSIWEAIKSQSPLCHHGSPILQIVFYFTIPYMNPARKYSKEWIQSCPEDSYSWKGITQVWDQSCSQDNCSFAPEECRQLSLRLTVFSVALLPTVPEQHYCFSPSFWKHESPSQVHRSLLSFPFQELLSHNLKMQISKFQ